MAGRIINKKIHAWLHLYLSLILFVLTLLYIVTGFIMSKHNWFEGGEEVVVKKVLPLNYTPDTIRLAEFGKNIKQQYDISGRFEYSRNGKNEIQFLIIHPGVKSKVVVHNELDSVTITQTTKSSLQEISTRIHRLHGFEGGSIYWLWAALLDMTAVAMILFSLTGILLWLRMKKMYLFGCIILFSTAAFGVGMIIYLN